MPKDSAQEAARPLVVRLADRNRKRYEAAARRAGYLTLAPWVRQVLDRAAERPAENQQQ